MTLFYITYFGVALSWLVCHYVTLLDVRRAGAVEPGSYRERRIQSLRFMIAGSPVWVCWVAYWTLRDTRRILRAWRSKS